MAALLADVALHALHAWCGGGGGGVALAARAAARAGISEGAGRHPPCYSRSYCSLRSRCYHNLR